MKPRTLFLRFSCGHEYFDHRVIAGGSGWENCLCELCQPYDALLGVEHPCLHCGGSLTYYTYAAQVQLSETEAKQHLTKAIPWLRDTGGHNAKG